MIEVLDHIAGDGKQGRRKIIKEDGTVEFVTIELADDAVEDGTPINRGTLMAMQGFEAKTTTFDDDGNITETNEQGHTLKTIFNDDGSITETFTGEKTITKTTTFNEDGSITEEIS